MSQRWTAHQIANALGSPPPTPEQCAVIEAPMTSMLVVAGAGSGKTETMAGRVLWLVANGLVEPAEVLGLTFTRKASIELSNRLSDKIRALMASDLLVGQPQQDHHDDGADLGLTPTVSTYHAYAGRIVAEHGLRKGVEPHVRLLTEAATWQIAHEVVTSYTGPMEEMDLAESTVVQAVLDVCGELSEHLVEPQEMAAWLLEKAAVVEGLPGEGGKKATQAGVSLARTLRKKALIVPLVQAYQQAKRRRAAMDFADQMAIAARLARDCPEVGRSERHRYKVVLLDEFQDTSEAQMVLLSALFGSADPGEARVPVVAVGDPHQSIYGWRGASATTLSRFPEAFATGEGTPTPVLSLSTSWRNAAAVLTAANAVAEPLRRVSAVPVQELRANPHAGSGEVDVLRADTHRDEAAQVAGWVRSHWFEDRKQWSGKSAAVLCRSRAQFDTIVPALREEGMPVEIVGLGGLLNAPELVDLVALLWAVQEPTRGEAVIRLLVGPVCRLGAADLDALWSWARALVQDYPDEEASLGEALDHLPHRGWVSGSGKTLSDAAWGRLTTLSHVIARVRGLVGLPLPDLLVEAERSIGLDIEVSADPDVPQGWGRAHLDALIEIASGFAASADRPTLGGFLGWLEAARAHERALEDVEIPELAEVSVSSGSVQVLTVHAAKGLEWDVVAVPGLADGIFPVLRGAGKRRDEEGPPGQSDEGGGEVPPTPGVRSPEPTGPAAQGSQIRRPRPGQSVPDQGWAYSVHAHKGWLSGIGALPYALRGDRDGLPMLDLEAQSTHELARAISAVSTQGAAHREMEERRLAYVALTRARHAMLLSAPVWSSGKKPRVTSRFLADVIASPQLATGGLVVGPWAHMPEAEDTPNPLAAVEESALWPGLPGPRRAAMIDLVTTVMTARHTHGGQGALASAATVADPQLVEMLLAERARRAEGREHDVVADLPGIVSTSTLLDLAADRDRFLRRRRRPLPQPPSAAAEAGTRLHAWIEQHYARPTLWDDHLDLEPGVAAPVETADHAVEATTGELADMQERFLRSEWADRTPVGIELAVTTRLAGRTVRGRIDAVFRREDGGFTVVDWKSGHRPSPSELSSRAMQLEVYRVAYARLSGVSPASVDGAFYFASTGETVWPELAAAGDLENKIEAAFDGR